MNDEKETPTLGNIFMLGLESAIFLEKSLQRKRNGKNWRKDWAVNRRQNL